MRKSGLLRCLRALSARFIGRGPDDAVEVARDKVEGVRLTLMELACGVAAADSELALETMVDGGAGRVEYTSLTTLRASPALDLVRVCGSDESDRSESLLLRELYEEMLLMLGTRAELEVLSRLDRRLGGVGGANLSI